MRNEDNLILQVDSYKSAHAECYPPGTTSMMSYIESRGGKYPKTLFFGLQIALERYLSKGVTMDDVAEAAEFFRAHGEPFNIEGWTYIAERCERGEGLPVRIRALPEGTVCWTGNALVTIESTDPKVFWLASWLETALLRAIWYPTTVATTSWYIKQVIQKALEKSSDDPNGELPFKLHDFGARGVSSHESAGIGGAAHLVNFMGSDTVEGVRCAQRYYDSAMPAFSIPATEHSTITSWGRESETAAYRNFLDKFAKPGAIIACVSDSYDIDNAISRIWGESLRQQVIDSGAVLVVRPDSGHPPTMVLKCLELLDEKFGHTINSKGYKVLNGVRVIQGDGINQDSIEQIVRNVHGSEYSMTNVGFGMGGALLQQIDRDTQKFAMKCCSVTVDGVERDVYKDPVDDPSKKSKRGRLAVIDQRPRYDISTIRERDLDGRIDMLQTVFEDGRIVKRFTLDEVRANSRVQPVR